jgi:hypothetical protein
LIISLITVFIVLSNYSVGSPSGWSKDKRLTKNDGSTSTFSAVAANGSYIHVVWYDYRDGNYEIYYKRSNDNGESWDSDIRLTNEGSPSYYPAVAVNGNNVHTVWEDQRDGNREIYYKKSTDNGENWESDIRLTTQNSDSKEPSVAADGNNIHVVWRDIRDGNREIYYKRSIDNGENWESDIRLTTDNAESYNPSVAVDGNNIHVVWFDKRDGNHEIYYKRSTDNGNSWNNDKRLTNEGSYSFGPVIEVDGNNIHIVWFVERDKTTDLYYKRSIDNGENWISDVRLTNHDSTTEDATVSIAVNKINVHIVWSSNKDGNDEIYYKRSTTNGETWDSDIRLTNEGSYSVEPVIEADGTNIHILWTDLRDGNSEIYYKQSTDKKISADISDNGLILITFIIILLLIITLSLILYKNRKNK